MPDTPQFCPKCAAQVHPDWPFCSHCGSRVSPEHPVGDQTPQCRNCGSAVDTTGAFCWKCGIPLNTGREPFIPVPGSAPLQGPKEELLSAYDNPSGRSGGPPPATVGAAGSGGPGTTWQSDRAYPAEQRSSGVPVWITVAIAVIVLLATLGVVWGTNGAGLIHSSSPSPPAQPGRDYVVVESITVVFSYNTSHQFLTEPLGGCAALDCPFLMENNTISGNPGWSSFIFYVQNSDPQDWANESAKIIGVSSSPDGIAQNGPGLALVDPDSVQFGVLVGVTYAISNPEYNITVDIEGDWS